MGDKNDYGKYPVLGDDEEELDGGFVAQQVAIAFCYSKCAPK